MKPTTAVILYGSAEVAILAGIGAGIIALAVAAGRSIEWTSLYRQIKRESGL